MKSSPAGHRILSAVVVLLLSLLTLSGCGESGEGEGERPQSDSAQLTVAVPVPLGTPLLENGYLNGLALATDRLEQKDLPLQVSIRLYDDGNDEVQATQLARELAADAAVIAVIGHLSPALSVSMSGVYRELDVPLLVPTATTGLMTPEGSVFRLIPGDVQIAQTLCQRALSDRKQRAAIYYGDDFGDFEMAAELENCASRVGLPVVDRAGEPATAAEIDEIGRRWIALGCDAVLVAGSLEEASALAESMRAGGYSGQVYCGDLMTSQDPPPGVTLFSLRAGDPMDEETARFYRDYRELFGEEPDSWALQSYTAAMVVVDAIGTGVRTPIQLQNYLSSGRGLYGILGNAYIRRNELVDRLLYLRAG